MQQQLVSPMLRMRVGRVKVPGLDGSSQVGVMMDLALAIELHEGRGVLGVVDESGAVVDSESIAGPRDADAALDRLHQRGGRWPGEIVVCGLVVEDTARAVALGDTFGVPTFVETRGRAFALAEGWIGAAKGADSYAAVELGETVDGGVVLNGRLLDGAFGHGGRIGHVIVQPDGRRCACGARGCLQAEASVSAIEGSTGRPLTEPTYDGMRHVGKLVGIALASIANLLDLRLLVCGGRVALEYSSTLYLAAQEELDARCRLAFSREARIVPPRTPEPTGLVAAAAVAFYGREGSA